MNSQKCAEGKALKQSTLAARSGPKGPKTAPTMKHWRWRNSRYVADRPDGGMVWRKRGRWPWVAYGPGGVRLGVRQSEVGAIALVEREYPWTEVA